MDDFKTKVISKWSNQARWPGGKFRASISIYGDFSTPA